MDIDDLEPRKAKAGLKNLEELSIEALEEYIVGLEVEIARAGKTIEEKKHAREGADSIFKK